MGNKGSKSPKAGHKESEGVQGQDEHSEPPPQKSKEASGSDKVGAIEMQLFLHG